MPRTPTGSPLPLGSRLLTWACFTAIASVAVGLEPAESTVKPAALVDVLLSDGQTLTAAVDVRSDEQLLWLRFDRETATLYRPIRWTKVDKIVFDDRVYGGEDPRRVIEELASHRSHHAARQDLPQPINRRHLAAISDAELVQLRLAEPPRAHSIVVDACVADWDADVEVDGVVLCIAVLNRWGDVMRAHGTLDVELVGDRRSRLKPQLPSRRPIFQSIGKWTRTIDLADDGQACLQLPFQAVHPEFAAAVAGRALVRVRLAVPGSGVLEASIADIRIRPVSQIRDRFEGAYGSRFFPSEATGRPRGFLTD